MKDSNYIATIPPSIYNAFFICKREAWLMHRNLNADQQNSYLELGRIIDSDTFPREKKTIYLADVSAMIDMVTKKDGEYFIAEIKKSSKRLENAIIQLKYYLYLLRRKSLYIKGLIKIPVEKKSIEVELSDDDAAGIERNLLSIIGIISRESPPEKIGIKTCKKCAHYERNNIHFLERTPSKKG